MSDPWISKTLEQVLKSGSKAEILEKLQNENNLERKSTDDKTISQLILENENLTEVEIIAIFQLIRDRGANLFDYCPYRSHAPWQIAIRKRMKIVTEFFMNSRNPKSTNRNIIFTNYFTKTGWERWNCTDIDNLDEMEREDMSFLEWLISKERKFNAKNKQGDTAFDIAIDYNLQHRLLVLLKYVRIPNPADSRSELLLHRFLRRNSPECGMNLNRRHTVEVLKILLNKGAAVNSQTKAGVELAIEKRVDIEVIKILIDYFPSSCDKKSFATKLLNQMIMYPCAHLTKSKIDSYLQILRTLVSKGADVDKKDYLQVMAVKACNLYAIRWLDEIGADFDVLTEDKKNFLHLLVVEKGDENIQNEIVDCLISKGCLVNAKDADNATPLHWAIKYDNEPLVGKLIEHGAGVNCKDINMRTPLHYAFIDNIAVKSIEVLLKSGANVNAKSNKGETPLSLMLSNTSYKSHSSILKMLLEWGAQVDTLNDINNLQTLKLVASNINIATVEKFLKYGLDINGSGFCRYLYDQSYYNSFEIRRLLQLHCTRLNIAKLSCSEEYESSSLHTMQRWSDECLQEIKLLETTSIDIRTSLYDFLCMNLDQKCTYVNHDKLKNLVDSPTLKKQFPMYSVLILGNYHKALTRKLLVEPAKAAWLELTDIYLPDICIERIFYFLSNIDLVDMSSPFSFKINSG